MNLALQGMTRVARLCPKSGGDVTDVTATGGWPGVLVVRGRWAMKAVQARTRIALKNILFATDFSKAADAAAPFASQIARSFGAKVYGLHVNPIDGYTTAPPEAWAVMAEATERQTKEHARRLDEQLKGLEHEVVMGEGNVGEVVTRVVKPKKIHLILLGPTS